MVPKIVIDLTMCKGCGLCTIACPKGLIKMDGPLNKQGFYPASISAEDLAACTSCALCGQMCPDVAIAVYRDPKTK